MYLHLGGDTLVNTAEVVGLFDLDTASLSAKTREFLADAEKAGTVVNVSYELPKSFVVQAAACGGTHKRNKNVPKARRHTVYISQLGTDTLKRRTVGFWENAGK